VQVGSGSAARTDVLFRRANEDLLAFGADLLADDDPEGHEWPLPFLCECPDRACTRIVRLTAAEFEEVREQPARFVVLPEHEGDDAIVERGGRFSVVERHEGFRTIAS
jgi:hypothetical protein